MPRKSKAKSKITVESDPKTSGFYKKVGDKLFFAPKSVHFPDKTSLLADKNADYKYPVKGWTFYPSVEAAYDAEGLALPADTAKQSHAQRLAARRTMSREDRQAEKAQKEADRIARLEQCNPGLADKLKSRQIQRSEKEAAKAKKPLSKIGHFQKVP